MGLTKQYLRYAPADTFGLIATNKANIVFLDIKGVKGRYCAVGACEDVIIWDIRTGEKVSLQNNFFFFLHNIFTLHLN